MGDVWCCWKEASINLPYLNLRDRTDNYLPDLSRYHRQNGVFHADLPRISVTNIDLLKKHIDEILLDPAFVEEIILAHCQTASPSELRKMAAQDREKGKPEFAYYLEVAADQREREEFT
jgi:hypothetical protein